MASSETDDVDRLAEDLVRRWLPDFAPRNWTDRLKLLNDVHEQLIEDLGDVDVYCAVSPVFIRQLLDALGAGPITSVAQAHIYANSDSETHRRLAGEWLAEQRLTARGGH